MPQRNILLLDQEESPWPSFLEEFFNDTLSRVQRVSSPLQAGNFLTSKNPAEVIFFKDEFLSANLIQKIKVYKQSKPSLRLFRLLTGNSSAPIILSDGDFSEPLSFLDFQKTLVTKLTFPIRLNILVVDDEPEVGTVLTQYMKYRRSPAMHVRYVSNGQDGLAEIKKEQPDVLVLDIKMPKMTGIEVYREVIYQKHHFPVIVYFDAVFGDEILELHKIGNPAVIEKGAPESSVENLTSLILKMAYFA